jgi:hypothetical protein
MKICKGKNCYHKNKPQSYESFYKRSYTVDGLSFECKTCVRIRSRQHAAKKRQQVKDSFKFIIG